jgi:GAF domain-containing protein
MIMLNTLRKVLTPPTFPDDENKTRSAYYLNIILWASVAALLVFLGIRVYQGNALFAASNLVLITLFGAVVIALIIMRMGAIRLAASIHVSIIWLASTFLALSGSGIRGSGFVSYFVVMLLAGLLLGVWPAVIIAVISVISGFSLAQAESAGIIQYTPGPAFGVAWEFTFLFFFSTLFMVLTITSLERALKAAKTSAKGFEASNRELTKLRDELEIRIQDRTASLEKRAAQLQAVARVARTIVSIQDRSILLPSITGLVSEQFGFYHTGIFLLNETGTMAVLQAANSEGGKRMRAREHQLPVDENSIVGYATSRGEPRIAMDVGADTVHFNNPDLPDTRSEMALPLRVSGKVIGAIDVQSTEINAFSEEDIAVLSTLADQVAIAIENARLFGEAQRALTESQSTFEKYVKQEWSNFAQQVRHTGFVFDGKQVTAMDPSTKRDQPRAVVQTGSLVLEKGTTSSAVSIPIKLRGQVIGVLDIRSKKGPRDWSREEIMLLEAAAERAALALETARLLESAQRRAARERTIGEISAKIGGASDFNSILRTTVEEMGRRIGAAEVIFELETGPSRNGGEH